MTHLDRQTLVWLTLLGAGTTACSVASGIAPDAGVTVAADADLAEPALVGLEISPPALTLSVGESQALTVRGTFDDGSQQVLATGVVWDSAAPGVAAISDGGVVTAVTIGTATLTARIGGRSAEVAVTVTGAVLRVFADDYGDGITFAPFGGSSNGPSIVGTDPHTGTTSLRIEVPAAGYTGGAFRSATPVDLSGFGVVTFWARASKPATLNVVGLGNDASTNVFGAEWNAVPLTTTWTRYLVPIPVAANLTAEHGLFHVAEGSDEGVYTLWLDDIQYEVPAAGVIGPASPAIATETVSRPVGARFAINGAAVTYPVAGANQTIATARRYFSFASSDPTVAAVDEDGQVTALAVGSATITARLGAIDALGALTFHVTAAVGPAVAPAVPAAVLRR